MTKEWTDLSLEETVNELEQMGTETTPPEVDESQYPLSYKEFEKKFTNKLVSDCVKQYKLTKKEILTDLKEYLDENPTTIEDDYIDCCEYYGNCLDWFREPICYCSICKNCKYDSLDYEKDEESFCYCYKCSSSRNRIIFLLIFNQISSGVKKYGK